MNPSDLIVICTLNLPFKQQLDLMQWYVSVHYWEIKHPSIYWWVVKYKSECSVHFCGEKK